MILAKLAQRLKRLEAVIKPSKDQNSEQIREQALELAQDLCDTGIALQFLAKNDPGKYRLGRKFMELGERFFGKYSGAN